MAKKVRADRTGNIQNSNKESKKSRETRRDRRRSQGTASRHGSPDAAPVTFEPWMRPQYVVPQRLNRWIGLLIFAGTLLFYILTQARSLSFWDAGEYITCGSILGIPHPPGNPFYILTAHFFSYVLSGLTGMSSAFAINLLSGIFSAFAVLFIYLFTVKLMSMFEKDWFPVVLAGFLAAMYTAFSFTFWNNAIEAEVYAGLAFTLNIIMWLTLVWVQRNRDLSHQNLLLLIVLIFFLGFGIHQTSLQLAPAVMFIVFFPRFRDGFRKPGFWGRAVGYFVLLILSYILGEAIAGKGFFPKLLFGLTLMGIVIYHMRYKIRAFTWLMMLLVVLIGLSPHVYLMMRSGQRPFINEGHPSDLKSFKSYIFREQYGQTDIMERRVWETGENGQVNREKPVGFLTGLIVQFDMHFLRYMDWQWFKAEVISGWFGWGDSLFKFLSRFLFTLLGFVGIWYQFKQNRTSFLYLFAFFFMSSFAMVFVTNLSNAEVRDRDYFYTNAYYLWGVWMAIGSVGLVQWARHASRKLSYVVAAVVVVLALVNLASNYHIHDRSEEFVALDYGQNFLNSLEENAIIFTNGDNDTFPLWYAQAVEDPHTRMRLQVTPGDELWGSTAEAYRQKHPDAKLMQDGSVVATVADTLILKEFVRKPTRVRPTAETTAAIDRAMEYKRTHTWGIRRDVSVANLSLLNTPWYIHQLRDLEGVRIEFDLQYLRYKKIWLPESKAFVRVLSVVEKGDRVVLSGMQERNGKLEKRIQEEVDREYAMRELIDHIQPTVFTRNPEVLDDLYRMELEDLGRTVDERDAVWQIPGTDEVTGFTIRPVMSAKNGYLLAVNELSTLEIIQDNYGRRPVYMAVTVPSRDPDLDIVPRLGLPQYLTNEGMVDRLLHPRDAGPGEKVNIRYWGDINPSVLSYNVEKVYEYRSLLDDGIYKDDNILRLGGNYGLSFDRLRLYYLTIDLEVQNELNRSMQSYVRSRAAGSYMEQARSAGQSVRRLLVQRGINVNSRLMRQVGQVIDSTLAKYETTAPESGIWLPFVNQIVKTDSTSQLNLLEGLSGDLEALAVQRMDPGEEARVVRLLREKIRAMGETPPSVDEVALALNDAIADRRMDILEMCLGDMLQGVSDLMMNYVDHYGKIAEEFMGESARNLPGGSMMPVQSPSGDTR